MPQQSVRSRKQVTRPLLRRVAGWIALGVGLFGVVFPGPGLPFLAIGILLLGPHDPTLRRIGVYIRLWLRRWSQAKQRHIRVLGAFVRRRYCESRHHVRLHLHRHERGEHNWRSHMMLLVMLMISLVVPAGVLLAVLHTVP